MLSYTFIIKWTVLFHAERFTFPLNLSPSFFMASITISHHTPVPSRHKCATTTTVSLCHSCTCLLHLPYFLLPSWVSHFHDSHWLLAPVSPFDPLFVVFTPSLFNHSLVLLPPLHGFSEICEKKALPFSERWYSGIPGNIIINKCERKPYSGQLSPQLQITVGHKMNFALQSSFYRFHRWCIMFCVNAVRWKIWLCCVSYSKLLCVI